MKNGLRRESAAARLLRLWARILQVAWMFVLYSTGNSTAQDNQAKARSTEKVAYKERTREGIEKKNLSLSKLSRLTLGPTNVPVRRVPRHEANLRSPSNADFKMNGAIPLLLLYAFMERKGIPFYILTVQET